MGQNNSKPTNTIIPLGWGAAPNLDKKYHILKKSMDSLWPTLGLLYKCLPRELIKNIIANCTAYELAKWSQVNWILCIIWNDRWHFLTVKYILCSDDSLWQRICLDNSFPDISSFGMLTWRDHYKFCVTGTSFLNSWRANRTSTGF